jgi:hypothetical protein
VEAAVLLRFVQHFVNTIREIDHLHWVKRSNHTSPIVCTLLLTTGKQSRMRGGRSRDRLLGSGRSGKDAAKPIGAACVVGVVAHDSVN